MAELLVHESRGNAAIGLLPRPAQFDLAELRVIELLPLGELIANTGVKPVNFKSASTRNSSADAAPRTDIRLACKALGQLDSIWNAILRESTGREMPRPPACITWSRTTSTSSCAFGMSATKNSTASGAPSSGMWSNSILSAGTAAYDPDVVVFDGVDRRLEPTQ